MISRVTISNFMGIEAVDYELPPGGIVLAGTNGGGKTSALKAVRACLAAQGIDAAAIRKGASSAEILVDLDNVTVRTRINAAGKGSVTVTRSDGQTQASPREFLRELLGISPLDPIELVMARTPEEKRARRATVLRAMPCAVSAEQLARWAPDVDLVAALGKAPDGGPAVAGHGIEVLGRVRDAAYEARTVANRLAKAAGEAHERALSATTAARAGLGATPAGVSVGEAEEAAQAAAQAVATARARAEAAAAAAGRSASTRARAAELRAQAKAKAENAAKPSSAALEAAAEAGRQARVRHAEAVAAVEAAIAVLRTAEDAEEKAAGEVEAAEAEESALLAEVEASVAALREAAQLGAQADDLLEAAGATDAGPTDEEIAELAKTEALRRATVAQAKAEVVVAECERVRAAAEAEETAAKAKAARLDEQVATLTHDAPSRLLEASGGIAGLSISGDSILLDGIDLDRKSEAERLRLAVDLARRLNDKSKLLIVDGLERVDPDLVPGFLEAATAGGFQLIATRVDRGPVHVEPIGGAS